MPLLAPKTFAPCIAAAFVLWPLIAYMGGQGFVIMVTLLGLAALFYVRFNGVRAYMIALAAFLAWAFLSFLWHTDDRSLLTGNVLAATFSVNRVEVSFSLTVLAATMIIATMRDIPISSSRKSLYVIGICILVQAIGIAITALFSGAVLNFLAPVSQPSEMMQNLLRNVNAFALLVPWVMASLWHVKGFSPAFTGKTLGLLVIILSALAFQATGSQSALVGLFLMLVAMAVIKWFPRHGFKVLFSSIAAYVTCAPILFHNALGLLNHPQILWPQSFFTRIKGWEMIVAKISEKPFFGHGLKSSYQWQDVYADHPEALAQAIRLYGNTGVNWAEYQIVHGHPHNMPLQIWLDTGLVGALLAAGLLVCLGLRLDKLGCWPMKSRYTVAGLVGICLSIGSFAYSLWNIAFWSGVTLACALIIMQARQDSKPAS